LRQVEVAYQSSGGTAAPPTHMTVEYDYVKKSIDESSLRMSAFGFPEPKTAATRQRSSYFWIFGSALAMILGYLVYRRAVSRAK
jgi:hypothetical protein